MSEPRALRRARPDDFAAVRLLQRIAVVANEATAFCAAIRATLDAVCDYTGWPVGHAYVSDPDDIDELASTSVWHIDHPKRFKTFREVTEATPLKRGVGLPGSVLETGKPLWIVDVMVCDNFPRAHLGKDIGVHGAFATPVLVGHRVVAVLEFFSDVPQPPDKELLDLMGFVGTQLGRVAERADAANAMRMQLDQMRHLIESAYEAFVQIDTHGRITGWNRAAEEMFGRSRESVMGLPLASTIIPHRFRERHLSGVARYLATGASTVLNQRLELAALRSDGEEFPVELAIWPVTQDGATQFCAFIQDITERKRVESERIEAEELIRDSQERLISAQEMAAIGSWDWDVESDVVTWSDQLYRNFGVSKETFTPSFENYMNLVHPEDRPDVAASITHALDKLGHFEFDHRTVRPDGAVRIHHCTGHVIVSAGKAIRMVGTNQDITQRKLAEDAVRSAYEREREVVQGLRELDASKTRFVSSVSHELRTPLTSIIGYLQLLVATGDEITDEHRDMLDIIERNSQRLLSLIEDLLTQSRIESGTFKLLLEPTPVRPIVEAAIDSVMPSAAARDLVVDVAIADDVTDAIGDAAQIERLLLNLLSNAIKFTEHGRVGLDVRRDGRNVVVAVSDTGIGIPEEDLTKLFSPFFRSSNGTSAPGTGLGLVLVKAIVDAHGGTMSVASTLGEGTTFTVRVPAAGVSAAA